MQAGSVAEANLLNHEDTKGTKGPCPARSARSDSASVENAAAPQFRGASRKKSFVSFVPSW